MNSESETSQHQPTKQQKKPRRKLVWLLIHMVLYVPFRFWLRTHVIGRQNILPDSGGLFVINHQSFLDPLFVAMRLTRPVSNVARDTLFKIPFIGWVCRNTYVIPISRTAFRGSSIRTALERLDDGYLVGIYPEGTRSSGRPGTFKPGFLSLARRANTPIYPVAIVGADNALPKGAWFVRPVKVTVVYGPPLATDEVEAIRNENDDKAAAELIQSKVSNLYDSVES